MKAQRLPSFAASQFSSYLFYFQQPSTMKLHLPSLLRRALLACLAAVAAPLLSITVSSGSAFAAASALAFSLPGPQSLAADEDDENMIPGGGIELLADSAALEEEEPQIAPMALGDGASLWTEVNLAGVAQLTSEKLSGVSGAVKFTGIPGELTIASGVALSAYSHVWFSGGAGQIKVTSANSALFTGVSHLHVGGSQLFIDSSANFSGVSKLTATLHLGGGSYVGAAQTSDALKWSTLRVDGTLETDGGLVMEENGKISLNGSGKLIINGAVSGDADLRISHAETQGLVGGVYFNSGGTLGSLTFDTGAKLYLGGNMTVGKLSNNSNGYIEASGSSPVTLTINDSFELTTSTAGHLRFIFGKGINVLLNGSLKLTNRNSATFESYLTAGDVTIWGAEMTLKQGGSIGRLDMAWAASEKGSWLELGDDLEITELVRGGGEDPAVLRRTSAASAAGKRVHLLQSIAAGSTTTLSDIAAALSANYTDTSDLGIGVASPGVITLTDGGTTDKNFHFNGKGSGVLDLTAGDYTFENTLTVSNGTLRLGADATLSLGVLAVKGAAAKVDLTNWIDQLSASDPIQLEVDETFLESIHLRNDLKGRFFVLGNDATTWNPEWDKFFNLSASYRSYNVGLKNGEVCLTLKDGDLHWDGTSYTNGVLSTESCYAFDWYANDSANRRVWLLDGGNNYTSERVNYVSGRNVIFDSRFKDNDVIVTLHGDVVAGDMTVKAGHIVFNTAAEGATLHLNGSLIFNGSTSDGVSAKFTGDVIVEKALINTKLGTMIVGEKAHVTLKQGGESSLTMEGGLLTLEGNYTVGSTFSLHSGSSTIELAKSGIALGFKSFSVAENTELSIVWGKDVTKGEATVNTIDVSLSYIRGTLNVAEGISLSTTRVNVEKNARANFYGGGNINQKLTTKDNSITTIGENATLTTAVLDGTSGLITGGTLVVTGASNAATNGSTYGGEIQSNFMRISGKFTMQGTFGTSDKAINIELLKGTTYVNEGDTNGTVSRNIYAGAVTIGGDSSATMVLNLSGTKRFESITLGHANSKLTINNGSGWVAMKDGVTGSGHVEFVGLGELNDTFLNNLFTKSMFNGTLDLKSIDSATSKLTVTSNGIDAFNRIANINIAAGNSLTLQAGNTASTLNTLTADGTLTLSAVGLNMATLATTAGGTLNIAITGKETGSTIRLTNGLSITSGKKLTLNVSDTDLANIIRRDDVRWQLFTMAGGNWNSEWDSSFTLNASSTYCSYNVGFAQGAITLTVREGDLYWTGHTYTDGVLSAATTGAFDWRAEDSTTTREWQVTEAGYGDRVNFVSGRNVHFASTHGSLTTVTLYGSVAAPAMYVEKGDYHFQAAAAAGDSLSVTDLDIQAGASADFGVGATVSGRLQGSGALKISGGSTTLLSAEGTQNFQNSTGTQKGVLELAGGSLALNAGTGKSSTWTAGELKISAGNSLLQLAGAATSLTVDTLNLGSNTLKLSGAGSLAAKGLNTAGAIVYDGASTASLIIDNESTDESSANLSVALTKKGNGKQTLTGTYSGENLVSVQSGTLALTNTAISLSTSANLNSGASLTGGELILGSTAGGSSVQLTGDLVKSTGKLTLQAAINTITGELEAHSNFKWSNLLRLGQLKGSTNLGSGAENLTLTGKANATGSSYTGKLTLNTLTLDDATSAATATHSLGSADLTQLTMTRGSLALSGGEIGTLAGTGGSLAVNGALTVNALSNNSASLTSLSLSSSLVATGITTNQTLTLGSLSIAAGGAGISFRIGESSGAQVGLQLSGLTLANVAFNGDLTLQLSRADISSLRALGKTGYRLFGDWDSTWSALAQRIKLGGDMDSVLDAHERLAFNEKTGAIYLEDIAATLVWDDEPDTGAVWKYGQDDTTTGWDAAHPGMADFRAYDRAVFNRSGHTVQIEVQEIIAGHVEVQAGAFIFNAGAQGSLKIADGGHADNEAGLDIKDGAQATFNVDVTAAGKLQLNTSGSLIIGNGHKVSVHDIQGAGSISGGTLEITGGGTASGAAFDGVALVFGEAGKTSENAGALTGSFTGGSVTMNAGHLSLQFSPTASNSYTLAAVEMNGGQLTLAGGSAATAVHHSLNSLTMNGGTLETAYGNLTLASGLSGESGALQKAAADTAERTLTLNLSGSASFGGSVSGLNMAVAGSGVQSFAKASGASGSLSLGSLSIGSSTQTSTAAAVKTTLLIDSTYTGSKTLGNVSIYGDGKLTIKTNDGWTGTTAVSGSGWLEFDGLSLTTLGLISNDGGQSVIENVQLKGSSLTISWAAPYATLKNIKNLWVDANSWVNVQNYGQAFKDGSNGRTLHLRGTGGADGTAALYTHDGNLIGWAVTLDDAATISVDSGSATFAGVFTLGGATLTKIGNGSLLLSDITDGGVTHSFNTATDDTGTFNVTAGSLALGYATNLSALANHIIDLSSGTSLTLAGTGRYSIHSLKGAGSVEADTSGTLVISAGGGATSSAAVLTGVSLDMAGTGAQTITGAFTGAGITVSGTGTLTLGSSDNSVQATGEMAVTQAGGSLILAHATNSATGLSGAGSLSILGANASLTLSGATGATNSIGSLLFADSLTLDIAKALTVSTAMDLAGASTPKSLTVKGHTLTVTNGLSLNGGTLTLNGGGRLNSTTLNNGAVTTGKVIFDTITGATSSFADIFGAAAVSSYNGAIELKSSTSTAYTLDVGRADAAAAFSSISVQQNTSLTLTSNAAGNAAYAGGIELAGGSLTLSGNSLTGTLTLAQDATVTASGDSVISSALAGNAKKLTKNGAAKLTLEGAFHTLAGLDVQAGKLEIASACSTASFGAISITGGELLVSNALELDTLKASTGALTINNKLTVNSFAPAAAATTATLTKLSVNGALITTIAGKNEQLHVTDLVIGENASLAFRIGESGGAQQGLQIGISGAIRLLQEDSNAKLTLKLTYDDMTALHALGRDGYKLFSGWQQAWADLIAIDRSNIVFENERARWSLMFDEVTGAIYIKDDNPTRLVWTGQQNGVWREGKVADFGETAGWKYRLDFAADDIAIFDNEATEQITITVHTADNVVNADEMEVISGFYDYVEDTGSTLTIRGDMIVRAGTGVKFHVNTGVGGKLENAATIEIGDSYTLTATTATGNGSITGSGTLLLKNGDKGGSYAGDISSSLSFEGSNTFTLSGSFTGAGLHISGGGTLSLTAQSIALSATDITLAGGSTLSLGSSGSTAIALKGFELNSGNTLLINASGATINRAMTVNNGATFTWVGDLSMDALLGTSAALGSASNTLTLTGANAGENTNFSGTLTLGSLTVSGGADNKLATLRLEDSGTLTMNSAQTAKLTVGSFSGRAGLSIAAKNELVFTGNVTLGSAANDLIVNGKLTLNGRANTLAGTLSGSGALAASGSLTLNKQGSIGSLSIADELTLLGNTLTVANDINLGAGGIARKLTLGANAKLDSRGHTLTLNGGTLTITGLEQMGGETLNVQEGSVNGKTVDDLTDAELNSAESDSLYGRVVIDFSRFNGTIPGSIGEILGQNHLLNDPDYATKAYTGAVHLRGNEHFRFQLAGTDTTSFALIILDRNSGLNMNDRAMVKDLLIDGDDDNGESTIGATIWVDSGDAEIQNLLGHGYFTKDGGGTLHVKDGMDSFDGGIRIENGTLALEFTNSDDDSKRLTISADLVEKWSGIYITSTGTLRLGDEGQEIEEIDVQKNVNLEGGNLRLAGTTDNRIDGNVNMKQRRQGDGDQLATCQLILSEENAAYTITGTLRNTVREWGDLAGTLAAAQVEINVSGDGNSLRELSVGAMDGDFRLMEYRGEGIAAVEFSAAKLALTLTHVGTNATAYAAAEEEDPTTKEDPYADTAAMTNTTYTGDLTGVGRITMRGNGIQSFTSAYKGDLIVSSVDEEGSPMGGELIMNGSVRLLSEHQLQVASGTLTLNGEVKADTDATVGKDGLLAIAESTDAASIGGTLTLHGDLIYSRDLSVGALSSAEQTGRALGSAMLTITGADEAAVYMGSFATDDAGAGSVNITMDAAAPGFSQTMGRHITLHTLNMKAGELALAAGASVATLEGSGGRLATGGTLDLETIATGASLEELTLHDEATLHAHTNTLAMGALRYGADTRIVVSLTQSAGLHLIVSDVSRLAHTAEAEKITLGFDKSSLNGLRAKGAAGWQLFNGDDLPRWDDAWAGLFAFDDGGMLEEGVEELAWVLDANGLTTGAVYLRTLVQPWYWLGDAEQTWASDDHANWDVKPTADPINATTGRRMPRHFSASYVGMVHEGVQARAGVVYLTGDVQAGNVMIHDGSFTFLAKDGTGLNIVDDGAALTIGDEYTEQDAELTLALANRNIPVINLESRGTLILLHEAAIDAQNTQVNFNGGTLVWGENADGALAYTGGLRNATVEDGARLKICVGKRAADASEALDTAAQYVTLTAPDALSSALTNGLQKDGRHGFALEWSESGARAVTGNVDLLGGKLKFLIHGQSASDSAVRFENARLQIAAGSTLELELDGAGVLELHSAFTNTAGLAGMESRAVIGGAASSPGAKYELHADNSGFAGVVRLQGSSSVGDSLLLGEQGVLGGKGTTLELAGRHIILSGQAAASIAVKKVDVIAGTTTYLGGTTADAANAYMRLAAGSLTGTGVLANAWGTAGAAFHHTLESAQLTDFGGWIVAGDARTKATAAAAAAAESSSASGWTLAGALDNSLTTLSMNLAGDGVISLGFTNVNASGLRLSGTLGHATYGAATGLENATDGLIILTNSTNSARGSLFFNSNAIQLGEQGSAGSWSGSSLVNKGADGEGLFRLVSGTLGAALAPGHAGVRVVVDAKGAVDVGGTLGSTLDDIVIHGAVENGSGRLSGVAGDIIAGGEGGIRVRLEFAQLDSAKSSRASDYLINSRGGDLVINRFGEGGLELDFTTESFVQLLLNHRATDYKTYLHVLAGGGSLKLGDGLTWDSLSADYASPAQSGHYWELLRDIGFNIVNGMGGSHAAELASSGDIVIAGTSKDVYLVLNPYTYGSQTDDPDAATRAHHVTEFGKLSAFKATVVDADTTLTVSVGALPATATSPAAQRDLDHGGLTINNLVGLSGSVLKLESAGGEWVVLNNEKIAGELDKPGLDHLDDSAAIGQDTCFKGLISGGEGVSLAKAGAGVLTVGDSATQSGGLQLAGDLSLRDGGLSIQGGSGAGKSFVRDILFAYAPESASSGLEVSGRAELEVRGSLRESSALHGSYDIRLTEGAQLTLAGGESELSHARLSSGDQSGRLEALAGSSLTLSGSGLAAEDKSALHNVAVHLAEGSALTLADGAVASGSADISLEGRLSLRSGAGIGNSSKDFGGHIDIRESGELRVGEGSALLSSGSASVSGLLDLGADSANRLASLSGSGTLAGSAGSSLSLTGGDSLFTGTLTGSRAGDGVAGGSIRLAQGAGLTLRGVTTDSARWSVSASAGSSLEVDVQSAPASASLDITLAKGSSFVYSFAHESSTRLHGELKAEGDVQLTLHSDGAQATGDVYLGDLYYHNGNLDYLRSQLTLTGTALAGYEGELVTLEDEKLALVLRRATNNQYKDPAMEKNSRAGANLLWDAIAPDSAGRDYIDSHPEGDLNNIFRIINNKKDNHEDIGHATAALAGSSLSVLGLALNHDIERQLISIRNRANAMRDADVNADAQGPAYNMWINADSSYYSVSARGYAPGYTLNGWGGTVGINRQHCVHTDAGLALSAMYNDLKTDGPDHGRGDMDATYLSAYVRMHCGYWTHSFVAAGGVVDINLKRTITASQSLLGGQLVDSHTAHTAGSTDGYALGAMYEVNYSLSLNENGTFVFRPSASVSLRRAQISGYTESGSDAGLSMRGITHDIITFGLGARVQMALGENAFNRSASLTAHAMLKADLGDRRGTALTSLIHGNGRQVEVESAKIGAVGIEFGAGLSVPLGARSGSLFLDTFAELRNNYFNANAAAGYRFDF